MNKELQGAQPRQAERIGNGHWLVAFAVALWSTETAFRIPLGALFPHSDVIVILEHTLTLLLLSPCLLLRRAELRRLPAKSLAAIGVILFGAIIMLQHAQARATVPSAEQVNLTPA